jgi:hypothetical protein
MEGKHDFPIGPQDSAPSQHCMIGAFGKLLKGTFTTAVADPALVGTGE